jgi:hypothetical protein
MELIPQGYIAQYTMDDLNQLVRENLKKHGKELTKPEPVSKVVNGKTVWLFECNNPQGGEVKPKKKYIYPKKQVERGQPIRQSPNDTEEYRVAYTLLDEDGKGLEVLAGPVHPL